MGLVEPAPSVVISGADATDGGLDILLDRMGGIVQFSFFGDPNPLLDRAAFMDELRVGTSFLDVACAVPEPTGLGLAGLAALGLAAARRRVC
jgi:MYXO-CTERM domain-containing protein